jgi:hypothetical protein
MLLDALPLSALQHVQHHAASAEHQAAMMQRARDAGIARAGDDDGPF